MGKAIKSMSLSEAKAYESELKSQGKSPSTSKEYGKLKDYIATLQPEKFGERRLGEAYRKLSRGVTTTGGWTEQNLDNIESYTGFRPQLQAPAGGGMGGEDIGGMLNDFQQTVYDQAGSVELRESISAQLEPDMEQPDPFSRVDAYGNLREEYGVAELETLLTDLTAEREEIYAHDRARRFDAEGKPVELGVIAGRVGEIERQTAERIDAINREINTVTDQLNTSMNIISTMINYMGLDYQDAVQAYNTEFDRNLQIYKLVDEEMDEQVANARANLQVYSDAITSGNMTYSDLSNQEKLMINKLEIQSGLPVGFISSLNMSFKDRLLGTSKDGTQAWIIGDDGNLTTVSTGLPSSGGGGGAGGYSATVINAFKNARADLDAGREWGAVWDRMDTQFPELSNEDIDTLLEKSQYYDESTDTWKRISQSSVQDDLTTAVMSIDAGADPEDIKRRFLENHPDEADRFEDYVGAY